MKKLSRYLLPLAAVATFALGSGSLGVSAGGGPGPGFGGRMIITIGPTGTLSSDGNAVTLTASFTCDSSGSSHPNFQGFLGLQLQQVQGKEVAFGFGGTFIPSATCNGTTLNTITAVAHPNVFGGPGGGSASPPFKPGKAVAQAFGNVCDLSTVITPPPPPFPQPPSGTVLHFCDFGGTTPTLVMLRN